MNFAPYQWRADQGYLPPPGSVPVPIITMPAPAPVYAHQIAYPPGYYPPPGQQYLAAAPAPAPNPSPPSPCATTAPAPAPPPKPSSIAPSHSFSCVSVKQTTATPPPAPASQAPTTTSSTYAPPTLRPGVNYMFPPKSQHTMLHIFSKAAPIWESKYQGQNLGFKMFKVNTDFLVKRVVERVLKKSAAEDKEECKGWCVTEVVEGGNGVWRKGTTIKYEDDKAKGTLESMGWNSKRGGEGGEGGGLPPVWLVVHKA